MKKIFAILLSLALMLSLAVPAMADGTTPPATTYNITAPNNSRTYNVYQIFTGDYHNGKLSNIKWGINGTGDTGKEVNQDTITALTNIAGSSDTEELAVIKQYVDLTSAMGSVSNGNSIKVVPGYYLFMDKGPVAEGEAYSLFVVEVVDNVTIAPKVGTVTSEKKVKDTNDSTGVTTDWQDSADYDIGDRVPFKLTGTVPADYGKYTKYYFAFHDVESAGLDFDAASVVVKVGEQTLTLGTDYVVVTEGLTDDCTFEIVFSNLKNVSCVTAGSTITVEYESVLNENAEIGVEGNPNTMDLEYSNNPNWTSSWGNDKEDNDGDGETDEEDEENPTGKTPEDKVIVFTYQLNVDKYKDEVKTGNELSGAQFSLYKKVVADKDDNCPADAETGENIKKAFAENVKDEALNDTTYYVAITNKVVDAAGDTFDFKGLDDGTYVLIETTVPDGYNAWESVEFEISAKHDEKADNPRLTELTDGDLVTGEVEELGIIPADIINRSGTTLPETGGMGTTIFYAVGGVMVAAAAILLITKKRMSAEG